ncbi:MFS transporter [Frateuria defendens]|uniref:MFS transporter n=1 Tax=Frateuria defendens TaxID=2219559 RepID=UPI00066FD390|nr:MFS transporter [Frateuria defendens]
MSHDASVVAPAVPGQLNRQDTRTLALSALGGALEFYDFVVFVFFTKVLGHLFFPKDMPEWLSVVQVYGIFAAGYLARPLGGIIMAHFGDRSGRKKMFTLSVFLMALPTLCIGLLPTYAQIGALAPVLLLLMRVMQGAAIGGEMPGAWVFVAEHAPAGRAGFAVACLTSGITAGILMGSLVALGISSHFAPEEVTAWAWRLAFLLGGVFGFVAVWVRRWLSETPVFAALRAERQLSETMPLKEVLSGHLHGILLTVLVTWVLTAAVVVLILMTPTIVQTSFHLDPVTASHGNLLASLMLTLGCLASGVVVDRLGRARGLLLGCIGLCGSALALYADLRTGGQHFYALYALAGLFTGVIGIIPSVMVAAFPPAIRYSGISFSYNVAYAVFGAITPPSIAYAAAHFGSMAPAYYVAATAVLGVLVAIYLLAGRRRYYER